jgi:hypothetical protein
MFGLWIPISNNFIEMICLAMITLYANARAKLLSVSIHIIAFVCAFGILGIWAWEWMAKVEQHQFTKRKEIGY